MSYKSLYRKWRPSRIEDIVGQDHITRTLVNAIKFDRISHAYLFCGPRGTGKTSTARVFSMMLNCREGPTIKPCNKCRLCMSIIEDRSSDVVEIDAASNRGIDEIRELKTKISFAPGESDYKVYIIDEVHMLTQEAFNALLKILEEPPEHVIFILATTEPYKLLPTILSRCQRFDFRLISVRDIVKRLSFIADEEGFAVDSKALNLIARSAEGAMRDALGMLEQAASYSEQEITSQTIIDILGVVNQDILLELSRTVLEKNLASGIKMINNIIERGCSSSQFLKDFTYFYRNLMLIKNADSDDLLAGLSSSHINEFKAEAEKYSSEYIMYILDILTESQNRTRYSSENKLILEMALVKIIQLESTLSPESLSERISALENKIKSGGAFLQAPVDGSDVDYKKEDKNNTNKAVSADNKNDNKSQAAKAKPNTDNEEEDKSRTTKAFDDKSREEQRTGDKSEESYDAEKILNKLLVYFKEKNEMPLRALIIEARKCRINNKMMILFYTPMYSIHRKRLMQDNNRSKIEQALKDITGNELTLTARMIEEEEIDDSASKKRQKSASVEDLSQNGMGKNKHPGKEKKEDETGKKNNIPRKKDDMNKVVKKVVKSFSGVIVERRDKNQ